MALQKQTAKRLSFFAWQQLRFYSAPSERSIPVAKQKYVPTSGTYPKGFLAGSSHAGVKPSNTKHDDIALVVSEKPCNGTAVFTRNIFKAAPVQVSMSTISDRVRDKKAQFRGVVINSGCANAVTGDLGKEHALDMCHETDRCFNTNVEGSLPRPPETLVMSTGVIGQRLPIDKIKEAIPKAHANLGSTHEHWMDAANAICTTDTFPKLISKTFSLPSHPETEYRIAGMTKGAGMIHPNMGTLLAIVCTDVGIENDSMRRLLLETVNQSFNSISIDGDTSTNDTVALFANGAAAPADVKPISLPSTKERREARNRGVPSDLEGATGGLTSLDGQALHRVFKNFMIDLAKLVVRDGEGATKFVTIRVKSDVSRATARKAATSIATSSLVKTALYGKDANWGRILCAIGYAPGIMNDPGIAMYSKNLNSQEYRNQVKPNRTSVSFIPTDGSQVLKLLVRGEPQEIDEERAKEILEMEDLEILVRLEDDGESVVKRDGLHEAVYWTCDFSHEYVTINGDYRT